MATVQITIRLPEEAVAFIDKLVADGKCPSRAAAVAKSISQEKRREAVERYVEYHRAAAQREPTEDEKSYLDWVKNRVIPPMDDDDTDWEAVTRGSVPVPHA